MTGVLIRRNVDTETHTQNIRWRHRYRGECHIVTGRDWSTAAAKLRTPRRKGHPQKLGRGKDQILSRLSEEVWPYRHLHFRLLASPIVRQACIVLSHPICCNLGGSPRKLTKWEKSSKSSTKPSPLLSYERGKWISIHVSREAQEQWHSSGACLSDAQRNSHPPFPEYGPNSWSGIGWGWPSISKVRWLVEKNSLIF